MKRIPAGFLFPPGGFISGRQRVPVSVVTWVSLQSAARWLAMLASLESRFLTDGTRSATSAPDDTSLCVWQHTGVGLTAPGSCC